MSAKDLPIRVPPYAGGHQCGFRRNISTTNYIFCIRKILEKTWEFSGTEHQIFIDFKKA
jgi:hypothetical protein